MMMAMLVVVFHMKVQGLDARMLSKVLWPIPDLITLYMASFWLLSINPAFKVESVYL